MLMMSIQLFNFFLGIPLNIYIIILLTRAGGLDELGIFPRNLYGRSHDVSVLCLSGTIPGSGPPGYLPEVQTPEISVLKQPGPGETGMRRKESRMSNTKTKAFKVVFINLLTHESVFVVVGGETAKSSVSFPTEQNQIHRAITVLKAPLGCV
ncbi:hypothetical protein MHYP_G00243860 [Metynnis hypsauchen]